MMNTERAQVCAIVELKKETEVGNGKHIKASDFQQEFGDG